MVTKNFSFVFVLCVLFTSLGIGIGLLEGGMGDLLLGNLGPVGVMASRITSLGARFQPLQIIWNIFRQFVRIFWKFQKFPKISEFFLNLEISGFFILH